LKSSSGQPFFQTQIGDFPLFLAGFL
jgi:hypothetical protein